MAIACVPLVGRGQVDIITTIAGVDTAGYCCDGEAAVSAKLHYPFRLCIDSRNNIYFADAANNRIRRIDALSGIISTVVGCSDTGGYYGDGGLAINANLWSPEGVVLDTFGNIYIADAGNSRIRKVTKSTGIITTIAGDGVASDSGDNGPAINSEINVPNGLGIDAFGNIYIAEFYSNVIRKINAATGIITTAVGNGIAGYLGDNGIATNAEIDGPAQVFLDDEGNLYFSDVVNDVIRKVSGITGFIITIAGTGSGGYSGDGAQATSAELNQPNGVFVDRYHNIFIADYGNGAIRKIEGGTGIISTIAGNGIWGYFGDNGPATGAEMVCSDLTIDDNGDIIIVDYGNNCIRKVYNPTGIKQPVQDDNFKIYPNPTSGKFTIQTAVNKHYSIDVCNVVGDKIYHGVMDATSAEVDISTQEPGVYFVYLQSGDDPSTGLRVRVVRKVVVE